VTPFATLEDGTLEAWAKFFALRLRTNALAACGDSMVRRNNELGRFHESLFRSPPSIRRRNIFTGFVPDRVCNGRLLVSLQSGQMVRTSASDEIIGDRP